MTTTLTHFAYRIDMWDANGENIFEHLRLNPRASALSSITGGGSGPPTLGYVRWRGAKRKAPVLKHGARGGSLRPLKSPASPPSVNSVPEMLASPGSPSAWPGLPGVAPWLAGFASCTPISDPMKAIFWLRCISPLLALSGHARRVGRRPLSGAKRTLWVALTYRDFMSTRRSLPPEKS